MFKALKNNMIIVNMIMLSIILFTSFIGVYIFMIRGTELSVNLMLRTIAFEEKVISNINGFDISSLRRSCFLIKTDKMTNIFYNPSNDLFSKESIERYKILAFAQKKDYGDISDKKLKLKFYKMKKNYGYILVFIDMGLGNYVFANFANSFVFVGIIGLIVAFFISLFLSSRSIKPIKESWDKQLQFVADASHELRTPLSVITSNLEIVIENKNETVKSQEKWLSNAFSEVEKMTNLINDLLFIARAEAGMMVPMEKVNLSELIKKEYENIVVVSKRMNIKIQIDLEDEIFINGNETRLIQLFRILVDNALKYNKKDGEVIITLTKLINEAVLKVEDSGIGISEEAIPRIFERFYKTDKSRTNLKVGAGLGLSIAECIIREHNAKIDVVSELGKGSSFIVAFGLY